MDEFFAIERNIGEVVGVIGLQNDKEQTTFDITAEMIEEKVEEEVKENVIEKKLLILNNRVQLSRRYFWAGFPLL